MTVTEAISKMQATVAASMEKLDGNGFVMSVETDYMNAMLRSVPDVSKAKYVTVSLVVGKEDGNEGEEYCMSLGAEIVRKSVNDEQLEKDIANYENMVNEAIETISGYEDKNEGLDLLTKRASEEYEKLMAKIKEDQKKTQRVTMIINTVFILGITLLFIVAILK
jgi:hypothetical protein